VLQPNLIVFIRNKKVMSNTTKPLKKTYYPDGAMGNHVTEEDFRVKRFKDFPHSQLDLLPTQPQDKAVHAAWALRLSYRSSIPFRTTTRRLFLRIRIRIQIMRLNQSEVAMSTLLQNSCFVAGSKGPTNRVSDVDRGNFFTIYSKQSLV
jgi:hypothetical protein